MSLPSIDDIKAAVDALREDGELMLKEIVSHPSLLNNEFSVQEYMEKKFKELKDSSLTVKRVPIQHAKIKTMTGYSPVNEWGYIDEDNKLYAGKFNVVATHTPKSPSGRSLIFNGHVDVVPTGPEDMWKVTKPFVPLIKDGRLYGRGAGDMKAGIVAYYQAYKALLTLGYAPAAHVELQTVVEEECTGNGALVTANESTGQACIIPEPFDWIVTAQLGVMWFQIQVLGKSAHVLNTSAGFNAIEAAFYLYNSLKPLEEKWNESEIRHDSFKHMKHPVNFNLGKIHGGDWASSVAPHCTVDVRVGFYPGMTIEEVQKAVEAIIAEAAAAKGISYNINYNGFQAEGCVLDGKREFINVLAEVHKEVTGNECGFSPVTCTTDARHFQLYAGIPATCYGPEATNIHAPDESVSLDSMNSVAQVLAAFIAKWCGLEKL